MSTPSQSISWRSTSLLLSQQRLGLRSGLFPSGFPTKNVHAPASLPLCATCPFHTILHLITEARPQSILGNQEVSENETLHILSVDGAWFTDNAVTVHKWVFAGRISFWKFGKDQLPSCVHYPFFLKIWLPRLENGNFFVMEWNALSVLVSEPSKGYLELTDKMHECQRIWAQFPLLRKRRKSLRLNLHCCNPNNWRIWPSQTQFSLPAENMRPKQVPRSDRWLE